MTGQWGRYRVERILSEGAMGIVYLAWDPLLERELVIKAMKPLPEEKKHKEGELRERFLREAKILGKLRHRNLVTVHDSGVEEAGTPYIVMEYVRGITLESFMEQEKSLATMHRIVSQILEGLAYAHSHGVIHRDLKPTNILITPEGEVKIADFGIARTLESELTQEGQLLGSPSYMAPEQIRGGMISPATDLYSLGVILYRWLTGRKPFEADTLPELFDKVLHAPPPPLRQFRSDLSPGFELLMEKALAKAPEQRFSQAREFLSAWEALFIPSPDSAPFQEVTILEALPPSPPSRTATFPKEKATRTERFFYEISMNLKRIGRGERKTPLGRKGLLLPGLLIVGLVALLLLLYLFLRSF